MSESTTALAPIEADALSPMPAYGGPLMVKSLTAYRELQQELIRAMPDQVQRIGDREFLKKGFWRAIRLAFKLNVELESEQQAERGTFADGRPNFGYLVTYRATAPNGSSITGDGACFAIEKAERFRCPHPHPEWKGRSEHYPHESCPDFDPDYRWRELPTQASDHNVRSHAHTRAMNRAISNLVAFGEVSAEEIDLDDRDERPAPRRSAPASAPRAVRVISEPQQKRLWAIAKHAGWQEDEVKSFLGKEGFAHTNEITTDRYEAICRRLEAGVDGPGA